jgi:hypothetical protein
MRMSSWMFVAICGAALAVGLEQPAIGHLRMTIAAIEVLPSWGAAALRPNASLGVSRSRVAADERRLLEPASQEADGPKVKVEVPAIEVQVPEIDVNVEQPEVEIEIPEVDVHPDMDVDTDVDVEVDAADRDERDLSVREEEKIQKTFAMPSAHRTLEIDNVWGSIEIVGTSSDQVKLTVNRATRAESKEKLEQARKEVTLDVTARPDSLKLYVNGPFRCDCHDCNGSRREFEGYIVKMDFQVEVPRDIDLKIKTVNEGHVSVGDVNGSFVVRNVNGDIQMHNVAGSGSARTVNGPVKVSFRQNPREASEFQTINGAVELQFAHDLAADFRFKTMNGGIYSDFPVTTLPVKGFQEEHRGMKTIFRADRYTSVRVNAGGPEIKVENLNGDIRILENHE